MILIVPTKDHIFLIKHCDFMFLTDTSHHRDPVLHQIVSHLLFVDDMLVYCKGDTLSALGVNEALHRFVDQ